MTPQRIGCSWSAVGDCRRRHFLRKNEISRNLGKFCWSRPSDRCSHIMCSLKSSLVMMIGGWVRCFALSSFTLSLLFSFSLLLFSLLFFFLSLLLLALFFFSLSSSSRSLLSFFLARSIVIFLNIHGDRTPYQQFNSLPDENRRIPHPTRETKYCIVCRICVYSSTLVFLL